jgi:3-oxoisoapionate kinase
MTGAGPEAALPEGVVLGYYGDDFTGSTDALEVLAFAGLKTVLFTGLPSAEQLKRFSGYRAVGIAGTARSRSPEWMDENLPAVFRTLAGLRAPVIQYKVCSTFDSAPHVGSIGKAIDLGMQAVPGRWSPCIVGAPQLKRWLVFGNLFAGVNGVRYRIDRHPTMSRHPVTPMLESDLLRHLGEQTGRARLSIDLAEMQQGNADAVVQSAIDKEAITFIDVADEASQAEAGRLVWQHRDGQVFTASSSGLEYALIAHWRTAGLLPAAGAIFPPLPAAEKLLVLSGSCSPVTAEQIERAEAGGFAAIRLDVARVVEAGEAKREVARVTKALEAAYTRHQGAVVFAAKTVDDAAFAALQAQCEATGMSFAEAQNRIGDALGQIAAAVIPRCHLRRLLIAGGDTSGRIVSTLPVTALEAKYPLTVGAPFCHCHSDDAAFDGLEIALKGGQVGGQNLFAEALNGLS